MALQRILIAMNRLLFFISLISISGVSFGATSLSAEKSYTKPVGKYAQYFQERNGRQSLAEAILSFSTTKAIYSNSAVITRGVGVEPVWLHFQIVNQQQHDILKRLSIETSWLDDVELYFVENKQLIKSYHAGDALPFGQRPINNRFFQFDYTYKSGITDLYMRVATPDPMVIPVYFSNPDQFYERQNNQAYFYGWVYGVVFALAGFNLMLFFSLKSRRYLYFSLYLTSFILMNMAYTGHAYQWLWPDAPTWQEWANHLLIFIFPVLGLAFATEFLKTPRDFPRLHQLVFYGSSFFALMVLLGFLLQHQAFTLIVVFLFIFIFSIMMVYLGLRSYANGNKSAKYFMIASITHVTALSITMFTTSAIIPYSNVGYHAIEIGMVLDAILLAMALADQFRINQEQKFRAERLAKLDPLTGINNRRAFYDMVEPVWKPSIENENGIAVILLDIDKFKSINDEYGHGAGDAVLTNVAQAINHCVRDSDIMARWGGEEFIILLPNTSMQVAVLIAQRVCQSITDNETKVNAATIKVAASIGVAHTNEKIRTLELLVETADQYLYQAKRAGGAQVFFHGQTSD